MPKELLGFLGTDGRMRVTGVIRLTKGEKKWRAFFFFHSMMGLLFSSFLRRASLLMSSSGQILTRKVVYLA